MTEVQVIESSEFLHIRIPGGTVYKDIHIKKRDVHLIEQTFSSLTIQTTRGSITLYHNKAMYSVPRDKMQEIVDKLLPFPVKFEDDES